MLASVSLASVSLARRPPVLVFFWLTAAMLCAQASPHYPLVRRLASSDHLFRQLADSISLGYRAERQAASWPDLFIAAYQLQPGEDLLSLAARFNLPYETLASLNGLSGPRDLQPGMFALIPSVHGLFIPETPRNDLDILLGVGHADPTWPAIPVQVFQKDGLRSFIFLPGARFSQTERGFFLNPGFQLPVSGAVLTSAYGYRTSPIDGHYRMHSGIDLAAPAGTAVLAARAGRVIEQGWDDILGNYIIIQHEGGLRSVYGHLASIATRLNQSVLSGTIIGRVGSTGWSTGPHLHFEIRLGSDSRNPADYIPGLSP